MLSFFIGLLKMLPAGTFELLNEEVLEELRELKTFWVWSYIPPGPIILGDERLFDAEIY